MLEHPIIRDLMNSENLSEAQATGALGLVLSQLGKYLPADKFALIQTFIPNCGDLVNKAPAIKSGLLGGLANTLGNEKAKMLMDLSKGLTSLGIPAGKQKGIAQTLKSSVEKHYPDLVSLIDLA